MPFSRSVIGVVGITACLAGGPAAGQIPGNATSLEGVPTVRIEATQDTVTRRELGGVEAAKSLLKIQIVDGRYYWASHGNRPLTVSTAGEFTYLMSAEPGRYVRFRRVNDRLTYAEHVDMASGSVTYWGELRVVLGK
jgi:hypothetical protein